MIEISNDALALVIAEIFTEDCRDLNDAERADGALIAAAPEMFEALKAWKHWYSVDSTEFNRDTAQIMGIKVLTKAQGGAK